MDKSFKQHLLRSQEKLFTLETRALGELYSYELTYGDMEEISKKLRKNVVEASPEE